MSTVKKCLILVSGEKTHKLSAQGRQLGTQKYQSKTEMFRERYLMKFRFDYCLKWVQVKEISPSFVRQLKGLFSIKILTNIKWATKYQLCQIQK